MFSYGLEILEGLSWLIGVCNNFIQQVCTNASLSEYAVSQYLFSFFAQIFHSH
jgi:hypothetical protein